MKFQGTIIKNEVREKISKLEAEYNTTFSTTQKLLLCERGPITTILDVLYGEVSLFMLDQHIEKSNEKTSKILNINPGEDIDYREVIVHKNGRPLVHVVSCIPTSRCSDEVLEDLMQEQLTTGKIIEKNDMETYIRINKISIEKPTATMEELFKTNQHMLSREYVMTHNKEVVIWTKESCPLSYFKV